MNMKQRLDLARWAVKKAGKFGATDATVDIANSRDIEIAHRDHKLETLTEASRNFLSLTIFNGKRSSSHSTADLRRDALERFIEEAVRTTDYLSEDPFNALPDPKYYEGRKKMDLKVNDRKYDDFTSERRVRLARDIEEASLGLSDKIISCTASVSDSRNESVKVHSNGFEGSRESSNFSAGMEVTVNDGQGGRPEDWAWRTVRFHRDLPDPETVAQEGVRRALQKIGTRKMDSDRYDILVENRSSTNLLRSLRGPMTGRALQQESSFLEGQLGEKIASEHLTWIDDPFIESGLGSRLYDGEGLATKRRVLIEKGVLKNYFIDCYYGRKLGMEPTGGGTTNSTFALGDRSLDQMIATMERGILITSFIGGNSNGTTGDFSFGIGGMYIENGKMVHPVSEMNMAGNMKTLWHQLVETGNDPYLYSSWRRPSLHFRDIDISGA